MRVFDEDIRAADADLRRGLSDAVEVIERYGDHYWPLFERLEKELKNRNEKLARLKKFKRESKFL